MAVTLDHDVHGHHAARPRVSPSSRTTPRRSCRRLRRATFGGRGWPYYAVQAATMPILVLAANTAYADFPRLASILARDRFLPRQFMNQGDRLAFSNGILILSVLAGVLLVVVRRRHARADPALHDWRLRLVHAVAGRHGAPLADAAEPGWRTSAAINGFGAIVTGIVLLIVAMTKAAEGAWIIIVMIPVAGRCLRDDTPALRPGRLGADAARLARRARRRDTSCSCRSAACSARS